MNTIDVGTLRETNEGYFNDIDMTCPSCRGHKPDCSTCDGEGEIYETCETCYGLGQIIDADGKSSPCFDCGEAGEIPQTCPDCYDREGSGEGVCPVCDNDSEFEIMWDTAYELPMRSLSESDRITAWVNGFLAFEYRGKCYLAAGGCGYDFSWELAYAVLKICDRLPYDYAEGLTTGGVAFLSDDKRHEVAVAAEVALRTRGELLLHEAHGMAQIAGCPPGYKLSEWYTIRGRLLDEQKHMVKVIS